MHRRSTLWFVIAAAWLFLLVLNVLRHPDKNTIVIGIAVAAFLLIGALYRRREAKAKKR
jgi:CHASE2 domain-containing sensor protein